MNLYLIDKLGLQGLTGVFIGANEEDIMHLEEKIGFRLPNDYRNFIKKYGASLFTHNVGFHAAEPSPWAVDAIEDFAFFYGFSEAAHADIYRINLCLSGVIPKGSIAIAHDSGNNEILLFSDGQVYFMDGDTGKIYLSASSFENFLDSFRILQDS